MGKFNYFEGLERLSSLSLSALMLTVQGKEQELSPLRLEADTRVLNIEDALFTDFLPPLERDNIAAMAHALYRIIDSVSELISEPSATPAFMKENDELHVCIELGKKLNEGVRLLRKIRAPKELPDISGFRRQLSLGRDAHKRMLCRVRSGTLPRSCGEAIILTARLRIELAEAYDKLVEIMLENI